MAYRQFRGGSFRLTPVVVVLAVLFACCLPWTIRNAAQFHRLIPVRANFPYELWSGNNEIFDEHSRAVNRITRYEQTRRYAQLGENAFWTKNGKRPRSSYALIRRCMLSFSAGASWPRGWARNRRGSFFPARTPFSCAHTHLERDRAARLDCGLLRLLVARNPFFVPVAVFPLVFPITFYIAHTSLRHRHPCDPIIALLMAIALLGGRLTHSDRASPGTSAGGST